MTRIAALFLAAMLFALAACQRAQFQVHQEFGPNPWTRLAFNNDPEDFQFAIVSDRTGKHRPGVFESALGKLNLLQPEFVMSVGDLIEGYTEDEREIDEQWDEIQQAIGTLKMPFFYVPGNHDIANGTQLKHWKKRFGRTYYHFVYRDVLFLCLDSQDPAGTAALGQKQVDYFAKALAKNRHVRWTMVFMHQPLWAYTRNQAGWASFESLIKDRPHTVIAGHMHAYTKYIRNDRSYIVLGTTGGGSSLDGAQFGTFDHVTWVTMKDDGPQIANLELDGIHDENVRTETTARLANPVLRGEILKVDPLFWDQMSTTKSLPGRLRLANPTTSPLKITGKFLPHSQLSVQPVTLEVDLAPESTKVVELNVNAIDAGSAVAPVTLEWTASFQPAADQLFQMRQTAMLTLADRYDCPRRQGAVVIDGDLSEWPELGISVGRRATPSAAVDADNSYSFTVQHDDRYVYVAVRVRDDVPFYNPKSTPWAQDGIEVRLDARPDPERSLGRGQREFKDSLVVSLSPAATPADKPVVYSPEHIAEGVVYAIRRVADGHTTEVAIPVSYLNEKQGQQWEAFRLNIVVNDIDRDPKADVKRFWFQPDWRNNTSISGSGTFLRK